MFQVIKRDGEKVDFTLTKINDAIMKAFNATQMQYSNDIVDLLALRGFIGTESDCRFSG